MVLLLATGGVSALVGAYNNHSYLDSPTRGEHQPVPQSLYPCFWTKVSAFPREVGAVLAMLRLLVTAISALVVVLRRSLPPLRRDSPQAPPPEVMALFREGMRDNATGGTSSCNVATEKPRRHVSRGRCATTITPTSLFISVFPRPWERFCVW